MNQPLNSLPDGEPLAAILEGLSADEQYKLSCRIERVLVQISLADKDASKTIDVCTALAQCAHVLGHPEPKGTEKFNALCELMGIDLRVDVRTANPDDPENKTIPPEKLVSMTEAIREKAETLMKDETTKS